MKINDKEVKSIRPMTEDEKVKYIGKDNYFPYGNTLFCIEFDDGSVQFPIFECCKTMEHQKCLLNKSLKMP